MKSVARRANLLNPESVKAHLASANVSEARKAKLAEDIARFYQYKHIPFEKPNYRRIERLPYVPLESEIDQLISGVGKKKAMFLRLLKETGTRPGEGWNLRWIDIDSERGTVSVAPEKDSKARQLRISPRLMAMLTIFYVAMSMSSVIRKLSSYGPWISSDATWQPRERE